MSSHTTRTRAKRASAVASDAGSTSKRAPMNAPPSGDDAAGIPANDADAGARAATPPANPERAPLPPPRRFVRVTTAPPSFPDDYVEYLDDLTEALTEDEFILRLVAGNYEKGEALFPSLMALIDAHHSASRPLFKHVQRAEFPYLALSLLRVMLTWGRGTPPEEKLIKVPPALLLRLFDTMASVRRDMFMDLLAVTGREWFVVIPDDRFDDILCKVHRPLLFRYPFSDAMLKTFQYVPLFPMTGVQDKLIAIRNKVFPGAEFPISIYWKSEVYKMIMKAHRSSMFTVRILLFAFLEDVGDDRIQIHFLRFFGDFNAWLMEEERNEEKFREQMSKIFPEHPHEALFSDCRDLTIVYSVIANNALPRNAFLSM